MPSVLPDGDPAPADGRLGDAALSELPDQPFGIYVHVPFCSTRCGYCDFNTYTAQELGDQPGASRAGYLDTVIGELDLAQQVLGGGVAEVSTIFVGGGTPTLLPPSDLGRLLEAIDDRFEIAAEAEITTESNPDSIDARGLASLVSYGYNRISFGMQSAVPTVLATLDRHHTPGRPQQAVAEAKAAGFAQTSLDLIYGTPGESMADWEHSVQAALVARPDHVSAYSLIVEDGTRLAAQIRRGQLSMPDDDDLADKYLAAEEWLTAAGFAAYEISNWATSPSTRCRHNLAYWKGHHWWGIGPGAHSHIGGVRWWNVKHPAAYAERIAAGSSPAQARESLAPADRRVERVLLELRLAEGLELAVLTATERARVDELVRRGQSVVIADRLVLTLAGRLLADAIIRELLD